VSDLSARGVLRLKASMVLGSMVRAAGF